MQYLNGCRFPLFCQDKHILELQQLDLVGLEESSRELWDGKKEGTKSFLKRDFVVLILRRGGWTQKCAFLNGDISVMLLLLKYMCLYTL